MEAHVLVLLLRSMYLSRRLPHLQARFLSHNMGLTETPTSQGLVRTGRDPAGVCSAQAWLRQGRPRARRLGNTCLW